MAHEHKYDIIAADLDGTLLDDAKKLPPRNAAALKAAHARGFHIVLATGRPPKAASWVFDQLCIEGIVLGSGGSSTERFPSGEILFESVFESESIMEDIVRYCRERGYFCFGMRGSDFIYERECPEAEHIRNYMKYPGVMRDLLAEGSVYNKCDLYVDPAVQYEVVDGLNALLAGRADVYLADLGVIDINPRGADKGAALAEIARLLGSDISRAVAFGDTANDIAMLKAAGLGVCMANGMPEALAAADLVAPSNNECGVAQVVEEYFLS